MACTPDSVLQDTPEVISEFIGFPRRTASSTEVFTWIELRITVHMRKKESGSHNLVRLEEMTGDFLYTKDVDELMSAFQKMGFVRGRDDYREAINSNMQRKIIGTILRFMRRLERRQAALINSTVVSNPHISKDADDGVDLLSKQLSRTELDKPTGHREEDDEEVKVEHVEDAIQSAVAPPSSSTILTTPKPLEPKNTTSRAKPPKITVTPASIQLSTTNPAHVISISKTDGVPIPHSIVLTPVSGAEHRLFVVDGANDERGEVIDEYAGSDPSSASNGSLPDDASALCDMKLQGSKNRKSLNGVSKHTSQNGDAEDDEKSHEGLNGRSKDKKEANCEVAEDVWEVDDEGFSELKRMK